MGRLFLKWPGVSFYLALILTGCNYTSSVLEPSTSSRAAIQSPENSPTPPVKPSPIPSGSASTGTATVTFVAPTNNGGSPITGYTVTSNPPGGIDLNAGSTSLTHKISGLKLGTSYTFSVRATNSVGSSVPSAPSNAVTPTSSAN